MMSAVGDSDKPVFGYWDVRGLGEAIRMVLRWAKADYVEKQYRMREGTDMATMVGMWAEEKYNLGLPFPNLPYFIDGETKLTQSLAILNYVGEKYGLGPDTQEERYRALQVQQVCMDFIMDGVKIFYAGKEAFEAGKAGHVEKSKEWLKQFSDYLGERAFICGDRLTATDFLLQEAMARVEFLEPGITALNNNLAEYDARLKALPELADFYASEAGQKRMGINAPIAAFNSIDDYVFAKSAAPEGS